MKEVKLEDGQSVDIVAANIEHLKELFPEAFTEDGVNFETLRQLLGDAKVMDEGEEKYGLNWHGKKKARQIALTPSMGTLLPCPEESVDWETTKNLFIEGDNLEVLKLLQKSYASKIDVIYIDPPYNTGKEFIYPDKFQENLDTYLKYTGQIDDEGMKFSSNTETGGRKHTNWLNMMSPRLKLARSLLSENGAIFISIDDNEAANLKKLCDEIYGENNFKADISWQKRYTRSNNTIDFTTMVEHVLVYAKSEGFNVNLLPRTEEADARYTNPDNDPRGVWKGASFLNPATPEQRPNLCYLIVNPKTGEETMPTKSAWRRSQEEFCRLQEEGRLYWGGNGEQPVPSIKMFLSEARGLTPTNFWDHTYAGNTDDGTRDCERLFGEKVFDNPKPTLLIKRILDHAGNSESIFLDFFSGSGTLGHALLEKNVEDKGNRRFICVQLPELINEKEIAYKSGYKVISEIGKERIRRVAKNIQSKNADYGGDLGFKVFKLASSNIHAWNPDSTDLEETLLSHEEHLIEGRSEQDVLYELLLKRGVDLIVPIESRDVVGKNIYSIGYGVLFACLDESITREQVENIAQTIIDWHSELAPSSETHVFFRDSAFRDDVSKTNMGTILEQSGINHVRSL